MRTWFTAAGAKFLDEHDIRAETAVDSAGAAAELAASGETDVAVMASEAAEIYGLNVLARNIEIMVTTPPVSWSCRPKQIINAARTRC